MNSVTASVNHCLECQAPLSPAETQGLCARCLLKMGLASQFGENSVADAGVRKPVPPPLFPFDFGGYRMVRLLGRGGMGAVYEAEHVETGRCLALKVLGHTIDSPDMRKRFLREGRLAASVNHPNSVYIFGTEEIDGAPVIAMELVAGGTLRDSVKNGPLTVRKAVDAILDVIAGLEAAAGAGVLHRDVKPANCFVAPDGTVKVGDFGLSVSTLARHDSQLTASGMMLGTPSFAPPEQLRGDELDVRADIYSVGATLYSLLTGRAPFEGDHAVQVVAAVLDKMPKPIGEFRKDVPAALVQVVGQCLAKKRDERFASYADLRDALAPFCSQAHEPAPVGLRTAAGIVDWLLVILIGMTMALATGQNHNSRYGAAWTLAATLEFFGVMMIDVVYFAISEGLWGASLGKMLCGLRVVAKERGAPGIPLAALRAVIFVVMLNAPDFIKFLYSSAGEIKNGAVSTIADFCIMAGPLFKFLLFVTMRRRNGFAAIHDLLTGTRVIVRRESSERLRLEAVSTPAPASNENAERLGPFRLVAPMEGGWSLGYDEALRRSMWIEKREANTPPLPPTRRDLGRAGRLRWIAGARGESASWDAFDAPTGRPLVGLSAQSWAAVRCWLLDLAEELEAAAKDGTLPPEIGLDQVWITANGRALLLDERWPGVEPSARFRCADVVGAQRFLSAVANAALDRTRLPLHARDFLKKLGAAAFDRASFIAGNLRSLLAKPAAITRRRRFASLALAPALALLVGVLSVFSRLEYQQLETSKWVAHPEWRKLEESRRQYHILKAGNRPTFSAKIPKSESDEKAELYAKYISAHFGKFVSSPEFESASEFSQLSQANRDEVREIVRAHPLVSASELKNVDATIESTLKSIIVNPRVISYIMIVLVNLFQALVMICISQLFSLLIFGATLGPRLFGFGVVNKRGEPAGRGRMLGRWCLVWWPVVAGFVIIFDLVRMGIPGGDGALWFCELWLLVGGLWSVLCPTAGPHDRLVGTHIVPR